jgi:predicted nucleotidyltransferase
LGRSKVFKRFEGKRPLEFAKVRRRERIFKNLNYYLERLKSKMRRLAKNSRLFLFGSVAKDEYALTGDIDVLILTDLKPSEVIAKLREPVSTNPLNST